MSNFRIEFSLVSPIFGGYDGDIYENIRVGIRWQKYISDFLNKRYDVSLSKLEYDPKSNIWKANCFNVQELPEDWLEKEQLVELLGTYNVIGIGKII